MHEIKEMQKNSHTGHCTHTAGSANVKVQKKFHVRNNITCSTDWKYRKAATLYPRNVVGFLYVTVITLCESYNKDNDDDDDNNNKIQWAFIKKL